MPYILKLKYSTDDLLNAGLGFKLETCSCEICVKNNADDIYLIKHVRDSDMFTQRLFIPKGGHAPAMDGVFGMHNGDEEFECHFPELVESDMFEKVSEERYVKTGMAFVLRKGNNHE